MLLWHHRSDIYEWSCGPYTLHCQQASYRCCCCSCRWCIWAPASHRTAACRTTKIMSRVRASDATTSLRDYWSPPVTVTASTVFSSTMSSTSTASLTQMNCAYRRRLLTYHRASGLTALPSSCSPFRCILGDQLWSTSSPHTSPECFSFEAKQYTIKPRSRPNKPDVVTLLQPPFETSRGAETRLLEFWRRYRMVCVWFKGDAESAIRCYFQFSTLGTRARCMHVHIAVTTLLLSSDSSKV